jgi:hypothetical protein
MVGSSKICPLHPVGLSEKRGYRTIAWKRLGSSPVELEVDPFRLVSDIVGPKLAFPGTVTTTDPPTDRSLIERSLNFSRRLICRLFGCRVGPGRLRVKHICKIGKRRLDEMDGMFPRTNSDAKSIILFKLSEQHYCSFVTPLTD